MIHVGGTNNQAFLMISRISSVVHNSFNAILLNLQRNVFYFSYSYGCDVPNNTEYLEAIKQTEERFQDNPMINWSAITWVQRPLYMWIIHVILAIISLCETILITYLGYKVMY
jgi:hypothetical protein